MKNNKAINLIFNIYPLYYQLVKFYWGLTFGLIIIVYLYVFRQIIFSAVLRVDSKRRLRNCYQSTEQSDVALITNSNSLFSQIFQYDHFTRYYSFLVYSLSLTIHETIVNIKKLDESRNTSYEILNFLIQQNNYNILFVLLV